MNSLKTRLWHGDCFALPSEFAVMNASQSEVVALLLPEGEKGHLARPEHQATLLVRRPDGQFELEQVDARLALARRAANTGCFRQGKPIIDPLTRQVMGYEMEEIPLGFATA
jgi:hypothetical protein